MCPSSIRMGRWFFCDQLDRYPHLHVYTDSQSYTLEASHSDHPLCIAFWCSRDDVDLNCLHATRLNIKSLKGWLEVGRLGTCCTQEFGLILSSSVPQDRAVGVWDLVIHDMFWWSILGAWTVHLTIESLSVEPHHLTSRIKYPNLRVRQSQHHHIADSRHIVLASKEVWSERDRKGCWAISMRFDETSSYQWPDDAHNRPVCFFRLWSMTATILATYSERFLSP